MAAVNPHAARILIGNVGIDDREAVGLGGTGKDLCRETQMDILCQRAAECSSRDWVACKWFSSFLRALVPLAKKFEYLTHLTLGRSSK